MAKLPTTDTTTADKAKADAQPDIMPDADDDIEVAAASAPAPAETEDSAPKTEERKPETVRENPRDRIYRRARELRAQQDEKEEEPTSAAEEAPADAEASADDLAEQDASPPSTEEKPPRKIPLKVNGKIEEVTEDELISLAQIAKASDNLLDVAKSRASEATRLLREAQEAQQRLRDGSEHPPASKAAKSQPDPSPGQSDPEHPPAAGLDPERLRQIAERIQVGDAEEGAQALVDLVEQVTTRVSPRVDPSEIERVVQRTNSQARTQAEIDAALGRFATKYPEIVSDELLADAGKTVLRAEMIKDLKSIGIADEDIAPIRNDERALAQIHRDLRSRNHPVRSYDDLLETAGQTLTTRFNLKSASTPQPAKTAQQRPATDQDKVQERIDRKRAAPQQPRAVGVRAQVAPPPQRPTGKDVVAMMRKARGFN